MNGVSQRQIENLFQLIQRFEIPITLSRSSDTRFAFSRSDLILVGNFSLEFLEAFSRSFPSVLALTVDSSSSPTILESLEAYSSLVWELDKKIYLGMTILPHETITKIIPVADNMDFLKLLFLTPAAAHLKNYLITKPKGMIAVKETEFDIILPHQRPDFIYYWLQQVANMNEVDINWVSGSTGELPEELIVSQGLSPTFQQSFESWLSTAQSHQIDDFGLTYQKILSLVQ